MKNNIVAIVQARQGSSRLPGKTLTPIFKDKTTLELMIERIRPSVFLNKIVVATTTNLEDDAIITCCNKLGIDAYRGSVDNVLDRYYQAAKLYNPTHVMRLTADCPLQDYSVIDDLIKKFLESGVDYAANAILPTYPDGFDAEIFTMATLEDVYHRANSAADREHVTPYIHRHPELYKTMNVSYEKQVSHIRLTLDESRDLELICTITHKLLREGHYVHLEEIIDYLLENPELLEINNAIIRNEGYLKSLEKNKLPGL